MCTARPGWQTISFREGAYKKTCHKVAINLVDILRIDTEKKVGKHQSGMRFCVNGSDFVLQCNGNLMTCERLYCHVMVQYVNFCGVCNRAVHGTLFPTDETKFE